VVKGITSAIAAYILWGISALYWRLYGSVPGPSLLSLRILLSAVTLLCLLAISGQVHATLRLAAKPLNVAVYGASSASIALNWYTFMWGSVHGHVLETGLGYLIAPLANILFGAVLFREKLTLLRVAAIALMAFAIVFLVLRSNELSPWVYMAIGISFGLYSVFRKLGSLDPIAGLAVETIMLGVGVVVLAALGFLDLRVFSADTFSTSPSLLLCGVVSIVPLWLFTKANRLLPLSLLGFLQYLLPTTQFLVAVTIYGQTPSANTVASLLVIWLALGVVLTEAVVVKMNAKVTPPPPDSLAERVIR